MIHDHIAQFTQEAHPYVQKSEVGALSHKDVRELDKLVANFRSKISPMEGQKAEFQATGLGHLEKEVLDKVGDIKETNLGIQRKMLAAAVKQGVLTFDTLHGNALPFKEKLGILINEAPMEGIKITGIPNKNGEKVGVLRIVIKPDILIKENEIQSQIKDPLYREELMQHKNDKHYAFELFDTGRQPEIDRQLRELEDKKSLIESVGQHLENYGEDLDGEAFNASFTQAERQLFNLGAETLDSHDIQKLFEAHEDKLMMFPIEEDSINTEHAKPTISGRFSEDGAIGELKSVSIHSPTLGGKELMDSWDRLCNFMGASQVFLEDDAKFEGKSGSYNMKLFRLMGMPDRASWYADSYQYQPYQKGSEGLLETTPDAKNRLIETVKPFKEMSGIRAIELLRVVNPKSRALPSLERSDHRTLGDLVKHLGDGVRKGEDFHKDIDNVFSLLDDFSKYNGTNGELLGLKQAALDVLGSRFYMKSYI